MQSCSRKHNSRRSVRISGHSNIRSFIWDRNCEVECSIINCCIIFDDFFTNPFFCFSSRSSMSCFAIKIRSSRNCKRIYVNGSCRKDSEVNDEMKTTCAWLSRSLSANFRRTLTMSMPMGGLSLEESVWARLMRNIQVREMSPPLTTIKLRIGGGLRRNT